MITAIETQYRGYRFRSRLEARWAVFFDAMGIKWVYEPEGFNIDGLYYLPDFLLPQISTYAEVKPHGLSDEEIRKVNALALESGSKVIMLVDVPNDSEIYVVADPCTVESAFGNQQGLEDALNDDDNYIILSKNRTRCLFYDDNGADLLKVASGSRKPHSAFKRAVEIARSARFEHGESPLAV